MHRDISFTALLASVMVSQICTAAPFASATKSDSVNCPPTDDNKNMLNNILENSVVNGVFFPWLCTYLGGGSSGVKLSGVPRAPPTLRTLRDLHAQNSSPGSPPKTTSMKSQSKGGETAAIVGSLAGAALLAGVGFVLCLKRRKDTTHKGVSEEEIIVIPPTDK
ncbi:hypothetical protein C8F04DRAFT_1201556 [Mycena alexandri]|uniref:Uncharacterized protein n=1 Tax=Mycena alexandri TaxID=1745969 RepID=A0AAD6RWX7_9AGAR|nr:hypothetical protein C8F04DRAFT_1201556 [Mycena alexandri]